MAPFLADTNSINIVEINKKNGGKEVSSMAELLHAHDLAEKLHPLKSKQECMSLVRLINRMTRNALLVSKEVEPISKITGGHGFPTPMQVDQQEF